MAKTRHYRKRARINNKQTRKHKGGAGSSPKKSSSGQTIVNVPKSAIKNTVFNFDGKTIVVPNKALREWLGESQRDGPTYR